MRVSVRVCVGVSVSVDAGGWAFKSSNYHIPPHYKHQPTHTDTLKIDQGDFKITLKNGKNRRSLSWFYSKKIRN